ncbi:uncharacterized protein LOC122242592 isoform X2 [Penaeus japonicus]|uniref:uncharacterized protein LOC122242592 isoform X2 n=1 Tax=Penaeus japonicus TaxID=27405 RepID=UPI001C70FC07|nr:uncharacterized protein LOC122242592 isoform X2 [Penaeus japonicus]
MFVTQQTKLVSPQGMQRARPNPKIPVHLYDKHQEVGPNYSATFGLANLSLQSVPLKPVKTPRPVTLVDLKKAPSTSSVRPNWFNLDLDIDWSGSPDSVQNLQEAMPNVPSRYWLKKDKGMGMNKTCAKYPLLYQIRYNNGRWQTFDTSNGTFYLFGAYYDNRTLAERPTVRVLGMLNRVEPRLNTSCQFWFEESNKPVFAKVLEYSYIWRKAFGNYKTGILQPYLLSCQIPAKYAQLVPESVSMVEKPCDTSTTNLRVVNNRPSRGQVKDFAVCVKGLDLPSANFTVRVIEWLEMLSLLGADKVFMYDLHVHPNITKVLKYYQKKGFVDMSKLTLPGDQPNVPELTHRYLHEKGGNKRLNELIPYNDCLYRNIYSYKYVVLLDTDELIIPRNLSSWKRLMEVVVEKALKANKKPRTSFAARNVYFLDSMQEAHGFYQDIPRYMHMLQHVYRARNYTKPGAYIKCFHDTQRVFTLHNHFPFSCLGKGCHAYAIPTEDAHLQHYRRDCAPELKKSCKEIFKVNPIVDKNTWRYKDALTDRVFTVLSKLGFFRSRVRLND